MGSDRTAQVDARSRNVATANRSRRQSRALLVAGAAAAVLMPVLMWAVFIVFGRRHHGFDFISGAASELGAVRAPDAPLFNVLFFCAGGVLTLLVAAAILRSGLTGWPVAVTAALVALGGVSLILEAVVSTDPASADTTQVHRMLGLPLVLGLAPAPIVLALATSRRPALQLYSFVSVLLGIALVVVALVSRVTSLPPGVTQRSQAVLEMLWFFATAGLFLKLRSGIPPERGRA